MESFRLHLTAVDLLWEQAGLGAYPFPLEIPSAGADLAQRAVIRERVWRELAERELLDGRRRVLPELADSLALLAGGELAVSTIALLDVSSGEQLAARAVSGAGRAVHAVLREDWLVLDQIPVEDLVDRAVAAIPDNRAAPNGVLTVSQSAGHEDFLEPVSARSHRHLLRGVRSRVGRFAVHGRLDGRGWRGGGPLGWFDVAAGRYRYEVRHGQGTVFTPTDSAGITRRLCQLLSDLR
ncbi:hypothetical protein GCM10010174_36300 [Kutzneria viridogrisea]|uniref:EspG family protein n=1 Tax=Kutzneria viridogrisea TaxID=47990 RepID=A0ABR6BUC3_9PSEU|nr:hypothetical protein [Kutzneria viridogrisea]